MSADFRTANVNSGSGTSITTAIPATAESGDLLLGVLVTSGALVVDPLGWTKFGAVVDTAYDSRFYWRICDADDAGTNLQIVVAATAVNSTLAILAYADVHQTTPIHVLSGVAETGSATTGHVTPALVTTETARIVEFVGEKQSVAESTWTAPAGFTKRVEDGSGGGGGSNLVVGDTGADEVAGTYGSHTWTSDHSSAVGSMGAVALLPAVGAPGTSAGGEMQAELNRLANGGTYRSPSDPDYRDEQGAAQEWADRPGRDILACLNIKALNARANWLGLQGVANQLAGTNGLGTVEALRRVEV